MSEQMTFLPRQEILTLEELELVAEAFVHLGVKKIRVTGGEPLVRSGVTGLLEKLSQIKGLETLALTTNGSLLGEMASTLKSSGVQRINLSLDTLSPDRFRAMTRVGDLHQVLKNLDIALSQGFERIKLNTVVLRDRNHDEVCDLVAFAVQKGIDISFIEEMPLGLIDSHDRNEAFYSSDAIRKDLDRHWQLKPLELTTGGPSRYWALQGTSIRVGFISPHSQNFCGSCNRVRLTAEGKLLLCLGNEHAVDLRAVIRATSGDIETLKKTIIEAMAIKPERHHFELQTQPVIFRHMSVTGG
jgi:cyclic pyranopterin phosphate synthase